LELPYTNNVRKSEWISPTLRHAQWTFLHMHWYVNFNRWQFRTLKQLTIRNSHNHHVGKFCVLKVWCVQHLFHL
jgi:hypothetical protein